MFQNIIILWLFSFLLHDQKEKTLIADKKRQPESRLKSNFISYLKARLYYDYNDISEN